MYAISLLYVYTLKDRRKEPMIHASDYAPAVTPAQGIVLGLMIANQSMMNCMLFYTASLCRSSRVFYQGTRDHPNRPLT